VKSVSEQTGRSMAQVRTRLVAASNVPVIRSLSAEGISTPGQSRHLDLELSAAQLKSLDGASQIELGFPQSIYEREMVRGVRLAAWWDRLVMDEECWPNKSTCRIETLMSRTIEAIFSRACWRDQEKPRENCPAGEGSNV